MARVTVEDCIDKVPNRFELVLLAAHRARMISAGAPVTVDRDNDKNPVIALREIAEMTVSAADLQEELVHSLQKHVEVDEPEPEAAPAPRLAGAAAGPALGQDDQAADSVIDQNRMSEEELLRGMENLALAEAANSGTRSR